MDGPPSVADPGLRKSSIRFELPLGGGRSGSPALISSFGMWSTMFGQ